MNIIPDSKDYEANMGPTWNLLAAGRPHVGHTNIAIRDTMLYTDCSLPSQYFKSNTMHKIWLLLGVRQASGYRMNDIDGLTQYRDSPSALARKIPQSCAQPPEYNHYRQEESSYLIDWIQCLVIHENLYTEKRNNNNKRNRAILRFIL